MTVISLATGEKLDLLPKGCAVALGFFDGVHHGHRAILNSAKAEAERLGSPSAVWMIGIDGDVSYKKGASLLTDREEKLREIAALGIDYAVISPFESIKDLSGEDFVRRILAEKLGVASCVCGFNFRFGKGASSGTDKLDEYCTALGISHVTVDAVTKDGENVSSTRIRGAVSRGDMPEAARLLGRLYSFTLPVLSGKALGRRLGFPTANQLPPRGKVCPPKGVYATVAEIVSDDGATARYPACSNVGYAPTVTDDIAEKLSLDRSSEGAASETRAVIETYIHNFSGDLYGKTVRVSFIERLRGEMRFSGTEELTRQIAQDTKAALEIYERYRKEADRYEL